MFCSVGADRMGKQAFFGEHRWGFMLTIMAALQMVVHHTVEEVSEAGRDQKSEKSEKFSCVKSDTERERH